MSNAGCTGISAHTKQASSRAMEVNAVVIAITVAEGLALEVRAQLRVDGVEGRLTRRQRGLVVRGWRREQARRSAGR